MKEVAQCLSCKKKQTNTVGSSVFPCPQCVKYQIVRCRHCREIAAAYTCPGCGFTGPA